MFNFFELLIKDYYTISYLELTKKIRRITFPIFFSLYIIKLFQIYDGDNKVVLFTYSFSNNSETISTDFMVTFFEAIFYMPLILFAFWYGMSFILALLRRF